MNNERTYQIEYTVSPNTDYATSGYVEYVRASTPLKAITKFKKKYDISVNIVQHVEADDKEEAILRFCENMHEALCQPNVKEIFGLKIKVK